MKNTSNIQHIVGQSAWTTRYMRNLIRVVVVVIFIILFLPWTQNIQSGGVVTMLLPEDRPQEIHAVIGGQIHKWYVTEGDRVKKGDTIVRITEVKVEYLSPELIKQTESKLKAKENSVQSYLSKINSITQQITQLETAREFKLKQARNKIQQQKLKIQSVLAEQEAARTNYQMTLNQFLRDSALLEKGLKSKLEVENRRIKMQSALAKNISAENEYQAALTALENATFELRNIESEYGEKLSKAEADRFNSVSSQMESEAEVAGLRNSLHNYELRNGFYTITAPQDGYITKALASGIGEIIKDGAAVCTIMPLTGHKAVEMYVEPVDMPLVQKGNLIRFVFDGWPTVVFSGWPKLKYGVFQGKVYAIDNTPSANGKFRVLVAQDNEFKPWPEQLRIGTGARGYMLLNNVPVWYEIWRRLNSFPPDYYKPKTENKSENKK